MIKWNVEVVCDVCGATSTGDVEMKGHGATATGGQFAGSAPPIIFDLVLGDGKEGTQDDTAWRWISARPPTYKPGDEYNGVQLLTCSDACREREMGQRAAADAERASKRKG